jgi:hypothetical protein
MIKNPRFMALGKNILILSEGPKWRAAATPRLLALGKVFFSPGRDALAELPA